MKIVPMDDRLLVELVDDDEKTSSGIILPDSAKEKPQRGTVIAVGTDEDLRERVVEGQEVIFSKYAGQELKLDGHDYLILNRGDILAILQSETI